MNERDHDTIQVNVRLTRGLRDLLRASASSSRRTVTQEMQDRLEKSYALEAPQGEHSGPANSPHLSATERALAREILQNFDVRRELLSAKIELLNFKAMALRADLHQLTCAGDETLIRLKTREVEALVRFGDQLFADRIQLDTERDLYRAGLS